MATFSKTTAKLSGTITLPTLDRDNLTTESLVEYPVLLTQMRVWDALQTNLPGTSSADDMALITGTLAFNVIEL